MRILLQPPTPWQEDPAWSRHRQYYLEKGAEVFLNQEVPYNITSNPCLVAQLAEVFQTLPRSPEQPLRVLELGGGLGLCALHLLEVFASRPGGIHYWFSDLSTATLDFLAQQPAVQPWLERGQLKLCQLDSLQPEGLRSSAQGLWEPPPGSFDVILANYHISTLPTAVLYQLQDRWFEKQQQIEVELSPEAAQALLEQLAQVLCQRDLSALLPADHPRHAWFAALTRIQGELAVELSQWKTGDHFQQELSHTLAQRWQQALLQQEGLAVEAGHLEAILNELLLNPFFTALPLPPEQWIRREKMAPIQLETWLDQPEEAQLLRDLTAAWPSATTGWPVQALRLLRALEPWLAPGGLWLISDKGYPSPDWMAGIHSEQASHHGDSLSHPVNFPLLERWLKARDYAVVRTGDEVFALQTLAARKAGGAPCAWAERFRAVFIERNANEESHALLEAGHLFLTQEKYEQAQRCLLRAWRLRPRDASLCYLLAVCLLQQENYQRAWQFLQADNDDLLGLFNFAILRAETLRLMEQFAEAVPHYQIALERYGEASTVLYNLGLCYLETGQPELARQVWIRARELDPADPDIPAALERLEHA